mgnify:CR=1 FL=1
MKILLVDDDGESVEFASWIEQQIKAFQELARKVEQLEIRMSEHEEALKFG